MSKLVIIIIAAVLIMGLAALAVFSLFVPAYREKGDSKSPGEINSASADPFIDLSKYTPVKFLDYLKKNPDGFATIGIVPQGWVSKKDVEKLILLVDSKIPCASVVSALSSARPSPGSTVGNEAMFMIEGYRSGRYPPRLHSKWDALKLDPLEFKQWWEENRGKLN